MRVEELPGRLREHWPAIREQLLSGTSGSSLLRSVRTVLLPWPLRLLPLPRPAGSIVPVIARMGGQFRLQGALGDGLLQVRQQSFAAQQVLRLVVALEQLFRYPFHSCAPFFDCNTCPLTQLFGHCRDYRVGAWRGPQRQARIAHCSLTTLSQGSVESALPNASLLIVWACLARGPQEPNHLPVERSQRPQKCSCPGWVGTAVVLRVGGRVDRSAAARSRQLPVHIREVFRGFGAKRDVALAVRRTAGATNVPSVPSGLQPR